MQDLPNSPRPAPTPAPDEAARLRANVERGTVEERANLLERMHTDFVDNQHPSKPHAFPHIPKRLLPAYDKLDRDHTAIEPRLRQVYLDTAAERALPANLVRDVGVELNQYTKDLADFRKAMQDYMNILNPLIAINPVEDARITTPAWEKLEDTQLADRMRAGIVLLATRAQDVNRLEARRDNKNRKINDVDPAMMQRVTTLHTDLIDIYKNHPPEPPRSTDAAGIDAVWLSLFLKMDAIQDNVFDPKNPGARTGLLGGLNLDAPDFLQKLNEACTTMAARVADYKAFLAFYKEELKKQQADPTGYINGLKAEYPALKQQLGMTNTSVEGFQLLIDALGQDVPDVPAKGTPGLSNAEVDSLAGQRTLLRDTMIPRARARINYCVLRMRQRALSAEDKRQCLEDLGAALSMIESYGVSTYPYMKKEKQLTFVKIAGSFSEAIIACYAMAGHAPLSHQFGVRAASFLPGGAPYDMASRVGIYTQHGSTIVLEGIEALSAADQQAVLKTLCEKLKTAPNAKIMVNGGTPAVTEDMRKLLHKALAAEIGEIAAAQRILVGEAGLMSLEPGIRTMVQEGLADAQRILRRPLTAVEVQHMMKALTLQRNIVSEMFREMGSYFKPNMGMYLICAMYLGKAENKTEAFFSLMSFFATAAILDAAIIDALVTKWLLSRAAKWAGAPVTAAILRSGGAPPWLKLTLVLGVCILGASRIEAFAKSADESIADSWAKGAAGTLISYATFGDVFTEEKLLKWEADTRSLNPERDWMMVLGTEGSDGEFLGRRLFQNDSRTTPQLWNTVVDNMIRRETTSDEKRKKWALEKIDEKWKYRKYFEIAQYKMVLESKVSQMKNAIQKANDEDPTGKDANIKNLGLTPQALETGCNKMMDVILNKPGLGGTGRNDRDVARLLPSDKSWGWTRGTTYTGDTTGLVGMREKIMTLPKTDSTEPEDPAKPQGPKKKIDHPLQKMFADYERMAKSLSKVVSILSFHQMYDYKEFTGDGDNNKRLETMNKALLAHLEYEAARAAAEPNLRQPSAFTNSAPGISSGIGVADVPSRNGGGTLAPVGERRGDR